MLVAVFASSAPCAAPDATVDAGWILQQLARPVPTRTDFVEVRDSKLLKQPLRLSGEYARPDADTLVREVRTPYVETTTIRAGEASIARTGKSTRRFSLSRAPELAGLQASFGAMLSGDRASLEQSYRTQAGGSQQQWTLTLVPRDAALAAKVRDITLHGSGDELRCIEARAVKGDEIQRTLLASAARDAATVEAADALIALCRGSAG
nr:LolA-related protein [Luteimonas cucumeris]